MVYKIIMLNNSIIYGTLSAISLRTLYKIFSYRRKHVLLPPMTQKQINYAGFKDPYKILDQTIICYAHSKLLPFKYILAIEKYTFDVICLSGIGLFTYFINKINLYTFLIKSI